MENIFQKKHLSFLISIFLSISLIILGYLTILTDFAEFDSLRVVFLDVGQGDSVLIQTPQKKNILIDGGPDKSLIFKLDQYISFGKRKIDYMILTHPDKDHLIGLVEILKRYEVDTVFLNGGQNVIYGFKKFKQIIEEKNINIKIIDDYYVLKLEKNLNLEFLWPIRAFYNYSDDRNFQSIVCMLDYMDHEFLLTGDADKKAEQFIMDLYQDIEADVLKAGHHGSKFSSSIDFLKRVSPKFFIISVGDNSFGHPTMRVLKNSKDVGAYNLQTRTLGDIIFFIKDNKLFLKYKN